MFVAVAAASPGGLPTAGAMNTIHFSIMILLSINTHATWISTSILVHTHRGGHRGFRTRARKRHMVGITSLNMHGRGVVGAISTETP